MNLNSRGDIFLSALYLGVIWLPSLLASPKAAVLGIIPGGSKGPERIQPPWVNTVKIQMLNLYQIQVV